MYLSIVFETVSQCASYESEEAYLYAFDFDHTIVDQNSDTAVMEVIHDPVPSNLTRLFDGTNWEEYMEGVFKFVAEEGGTYEIIADKIRQLQATEGMHETYDLYCINYVIINYIIVH